MRRCLKASFFLFATLLLSLLSPAIAAPPLIQAKLTQDTPFTANEPLLPAEADRARDVRIRHSPALMELPDVVGVGLTLSARNRPAILVLLRGQVADGALPAHIEGVPVVRLITGRIHAMPSPKVKPPKPDKETGIAPSDYFPRPVPIGISTGNIGECSSGTIGVRVVNSAGNVFALSNNHVFALGNEAPLGSPIVQPGVYDSEPICYQNTENVIGTLEDYEQIKFLGEGTNLIDAAITATSEASLGRSTPPDGYGTPASTPYTLSTEDLLLPVQKYGRTTGLTRGAVEAVELRVKVSYDTQIAQFTNQILVSSRKAFIKAGDSGSLLVTTAGNQPVGLLFAGSTTGKYAIANPIDEVLERFEVEIDGAP